MGLGQRAVRVLGLLALLCAMRIRLYDQSPITFGDNLILRLPRGSWAGPPKFLWMRLPIVNQLYGTYQYGTDGVLAGSNTPVGPIFPVEVKFEFEPGRPLIVRLSTQPV
jgi:hypothetical protein